jgi:hypothetical protein
MMAVRERSVSGDGVQFTLVKAKLWSSAQLRIKPKSSVYNTANCIAQRSRLGRRDVICLVSQAIPAAIVEAAWALRGGGPVRGQPGVAISFGNSLKLLRKSGFLGCRAGPGGVYLGR